MNRKITGRKSEIKSDARVQAIIRAVGLYSAGRPFSEIRRAAGVDSSLVNRYVHRMLSAWQEVQAPRAVGLRGRRPPCAADARTGRGMARIGGPK